MKGPNLVRASRAANTLLAKRGVTAPPVNVRQLAELEGITFDVAELDHSAPGFRLWYPERHLLVLNTLHDVVHQRFMIAHALGQHLLDSSFEDIVIYDTLEYFSLTPIEGLPSIFATPNLEANAFAEAVLMPKAFLDRDFDEWRVDVHDDAGMRKLANRYQVTVAALTLRLMRLRMLCG